MNETTCLVWPTKPSKSSSEEAKGLAYHQNGATVVEPWYDDKDEGGAEEEEELVELRILMMPDDRQKAALLLFSDSVHSYWQKDKMNNNRSSSNKRGRCITKTLLSLMLGYMLLLGLPHYFYSSSVSTPSLAKSSSIFMLSAASNAQLLLMNNPDYSDDVVDNATTTATINNLTTITFGELAQQMLPGSYSKMLSGLTVITDGVMPDQIYKERKAILETRDLMDVFSPVYPPTTSSNSSSSSSSSSNDKKKKNDDDMWMMLRSYLDDGYMIIGEFQDLFASHANYTAEYIDLLQGLVLKWNVEFETFRQTHDIPTYLSESPSLTSKHFSHKKESKLFWRMVKDVPRGNHLATECLHFLGAAQLETTLQYMKMIAPLTSVLNTVEHTQYHEVRKLLRSVLDEYKLFGTLMFPDTNATVAVMSQIDLARHLLGDMNDHYSKYTIESMPGNNTTQAALDQTANEIQGEWDNIKSWIIETDLEGNLKSLQQELMS